MSLLSRVFEHIGAEEVVELTRALVRIPSVYRPGEPGANEAEVAAFVESWFRREGLPVDVQQVAPGRPNVLAWVGEKGPGRRCLLLEGHTDVVTEG
ncbi:MAG TPA: M20 family peptidase, partial [Methylomirabilota bacterium]|nr:M20 family peptidase [Methylomirabilota bacterium]